MQEEKDDVANLHDNLSDGFSIVNDSQETILNIVPKMGELTTYEHYPGLDERSIGGMNQWLSTVPTAASTFAGNSNRTYANY